MKADYYFSCFRAVLLYTVLALGNVFQLYVGEKSA